MSDNIDFKISNLFLVELILIWPIINFFGNFDRYNFKFFFFYYYFFVAQTDSEVNPNSWLGLEQRVTQMSAVVNSDS